MTTQTNLQSGYQLQDFDQHGFAILKQLAPADLVKRIREVALRDLELMQEPLEYEADVNYPGSPDSYQSPGGRTVRRLKQAYSRDPVYQQWLNHPDLIRSLTSILGSPLLCPLAHHNCVMTKHPEFSSDTGWHQDIRFWSFESSNLISAWLALGSETLENGCLQVIPGTHQMRFDSEQLTDDLFLDTDYPANQSLLQSRINVELAPGDLLLFHAKTFHAATRNYTADVKLSLVFTFMSTDNSPIKNTRSADDPCITLPS